MKKQWLLSGWLFFMVVCPATAWGFDDLFRQKKSDSAIKPLVFPLSMQVLENRPLKGQYYFFEGENARFDKGLEGTPKPRDGFYNVLSDPAIIRKTLVKSDPARINPSTRGDDNRGPVSKSILKEISKNISKDLILVFRREIRVNSTKPLPPSLFQNPEEMFTHTRPGPYSITIRTQGLVYLAKQNKILTIPCNEKSKSFLIEEKDSREVTVKEVWRQMSEKGLEELAASAKKAILDKQFVVRRPTY